MPYKNRDDRLRTSKAWRLAHPKEARANIFRWEQENRDKIHAYHAKYKASAKGKARDRAYAKRMRETDANTKIRSNLRSRLWASLNRAGAAKSAGTMSLIGCDVQFLRGYLEARFLPGMTWQNNGVGKGKWHIDHHIPLAEFDLREPAQQRQGFHYSNLRPMWSADNLSKSDKRPPTHQAELI